MVGSVRVALAILIVAILTVPLAGLQLVALKTGWFNRSRLPMIWHRLIVRALGIRILVQGRMETGRPLLLASNHISWADIMVLGSVADVSFIAKSETAGWPLIGRLSHLQRTVFIERERREKSAEQATEIGRRLAKGDAMVLFPEATTSDGNVLLPFKSTLFGAARMVLDEGAAEAVLIQPVAISYTRLHGMPMGRQHRGLAAWIGDSPLVPHILGLLRAGAVDVEVAFGEPVEFTLQSSRKAVARLVEERVRHMRAHALRGRAGSE